MKVSERAERRRGQLTFSHTEGAERNESGEKREFQRKLKSSAQFIL